MNHWLRLETLGDKRMQFDYLNIQKGKIHGTLLPK